MILGTLVLAAAHHGAGRYNECGKVWRRSVIYAFGLGLVGLTVCLFGEIILYILGQSRALVFEGAEVIRVLGLGLPAHLVFLSGSFFWRG